MPSKKSLKKKLSINRQTIIVIGLSFLVSAIVGFIAGSAAFELSQYVHQNEFLQRLIPEEAEEKPKDEGVIISGDLFEQENQITKIIEQASPAVVSIIVSKDLPIIQRQMIDPFEGFFDGTPFEDYFSPEYDQEDEDEETKKQEIGGGTGFVVGEDGLILTNRHVVVDEDAEYTILTNDGEKYDAEIVARDRLQDLAFLRAKDINVRPLLLGDSDNIKIGQTAITIGNALGEFSNTVSVGVISGLRRSIDAFSSLTGRSEELDQVIQTDAAINQGNSGGPLLNLNGEVVGVNTAMAYNAENIGFAIPINAAKKNIEEIKETGKITYPYLGVRYTLINKIIQEENSLSVDYGALIIRGDEEGELAVVPGSPADKADLRENDIILKVNNKEINEDYTLAEAILNYKVGEEIELEVLSKGEIKTLEVVLEKMPTNFD